MSIAFLLHAKTEEFAQISQTHTLVSAALDSWEIIVRKVNPNSNV